MLFEKGFVLILEVFSLLKPIFSQTQFLLEWAKLVLQPIDFPLVVVDVVFSWRFVMEIAVGVRINIFSLPSISVVSSPRSLELNSISVGSLPSLAGVRTWSFWHFWFVKYNNLKLNYSLIKFQILTSGHQIFSLSKYHFFPWKSLYAVFSQILIAFFQHF